MTSAPFVDEKLHQFQILILSGSLVQLYQADLYLLMTTHIPAFTHPKQPSYEVSVLDRYFQ